MGKMIISNSSNDKYLLTLCDSENSIICLHLWDGKDANKFVYILNFFKTRRSERITFVCDDKNREIFLLCRKYVPAICTNNMNKEKFE